MVESEALSAFAALDMRVRALLWNHCFCIVLQLCWIDFWQVQHFTAFAVVDFLQTPQRGAGPGIVAGVTFVGESFLCIWLLFVDAWDLGPECPR